MPEHQVRDHLASRMGRAGVGGWPEVTGSTRPTPVMPTPTPLAHPAFA